MSISSALFVIALIGVMLVGYVHTASSYEAREGYRATAHALNSLQTTLYRWHVDWREDTDTDGWHRPVDLVPPAVDDLDRLLAYFPTNPATGNPPTGTLSGSHFLISGFDHGGGYEAVVTWTHVTSNPSIQLRLLGSWTDVARSYIQSVIPVVQREDNDVDAAGTLALTGKDHALRLDIPHPGTQAVLANSMRRHVVRDAGRMQGLVSPLLFESAAVVVHSDGCGSMSAMSADAQGVPMACVDHDADLTTERLWKPIISTRAYCRDLRLTPTDPHWVLNAPNHIVVYDTDWSTAKNPGTDGLQVRIPATEIGGVWSCPAPFVLDPLTNFCEHTFL